MNFEEQIKTVIDGFGTWFNDEDKMKKGMMTDIVGAGPAGVALTVTLKKIKSKQYLTYLPLKTCLSLYYVI